MKRLSEYLKESIFDMDEKDVEENIKASISKFLEANYIGTFSISKIPNKDGKYVVDSNGSVAIENEKIDNLTNDLFVWGKVDGSFNCCGCESLTSLEGSPKTVGEGFYCKNCKSLTSLKGAPEKVNENFNCSYCNSLKSLEGSPNEVGGDFFCRDCNSLTSLEGAPKKIGGKLCSNLI